MEFPRSELDQHARRILSKGAALHDRVASYDEALVRLKQEAELIEAIYTDERNGIVRIGEDNWSKFLEIRRTVLDRIHGCEFYLSLINGEREDVKGPAIAIVS